MFPKHQKAQLRWAGHVVRMEDTRLPKALFYGQLSSGFRNQGRPLLRYKDTLKANLKACKMNLKTWEAEALDRAQWRSSGHQAICNLEVARIDVLEEKRAQRKVTFRLPPTDGDLICNICGRICKSRTGLHSHMRRHSRTGS